MSASKNFGQATFDQEGRDWPATIKAIIVPISARRLKTALEHCDKARSLCARLPRVGFLTRRPSMQDESRISELGMAFALHVANRDFRRMNMVRSLFAALLLNALPTVALADSIEDLDRLDNRIEVLTGAAPGQPGGAITPLDRRMKLAACPQPATIEWAGSDALAVRCPAIGWRLRVGIAPVGLSQGKAMLSVHRGDTVEVSVSGDTFDVTATGIALDDGAEGSSIRLKIGATGTQTSAIVTGPGMVSLSR